MYRFPTASVWINAVVAFFRFQLCFRSLSVYMQRGAIRRHGYCHLTKEDVSVLPLDMSVVLLEWNPDTLPEQFLSRHFSLPLSSPYADDENSS